MNDTSKRKKPLTGFGQLETIPDVLKDIEQKETKSTVQTSEAAKPKAPNKPKKPKKEKKKPVEKKPVHVLLTAEEYEIFKEKLNDRVIQRVVHRIIMNWVNDPNAN